MVECKKISVDYTLVLFLCIFNVRLCRLHVGDIFMHFMRYIIVF